MLTLAFCALAWSFLAAQSDYKPMLELTRFRWINGWYDNNMGKELNYMYDTVVENRQLKVYNFHHEGWAFLNNREYLREDVQERKVWQCYPGNDTIPYSEFLLYDFSLEPGDTLSLDYQSPDTFRLEYVHHIDTVQLLDGPHRRIVVYLWWEGSNYASVNGNQHYYDIIEGVGNLYMPLYSKTQSWYFTPLCAWRGDQPVVGACEVAQINCGAITIDSLINFNDYFQIQLSYGQSDWPVYAYKLMVMNMAGDTLAMSLYSSGNIQPNETVTDWIDTRENVTDLPNPARVIIIDQLTQQQCEVLFTTTGLRHTPVSEWLKVYPNPSDGQFQVEVPDDFEVARIDLFDAQGRNCAIQADRNTATLRITTGQLKPGIYSLLLLSTDGKTSAARILVGR